MSATWDMTRGTGRINGVSILSLDAGGPRAISQLGILKEIIEVFSRKANGDHERTEKRPCEVFAAIGGTGTGGLIAILLVVLEMTANEALEEFISLAIKVFKEVDRDQERQTKRLHQAIKDILDKRQINPDTKLVSSSGATPKCRLVVPISYKNNVGSTCVLTNYVDNQGPPTNLTIAQAMFATCATPPMFSSIRVEKDFSIFEYISADLGLSNPLREIVDVAYRAFGNETVVTSLLSIGCGHTGVNVSPETSDTTSQLAFLERVATDGERAAQEIGRQMENLTLYYRFSVVYGLETSSYRSWRDPADIATQTNNYLKNLEVAEVLENCVETIRSGFGFTTLEQLTQSVGEEVLPSEMLQLTPNYVERKAPMDFIKKSILDESGNVKAGSKRTIVTGVGGCGKTQLIRKFIEEHGDRFKSVFFVDGTSVETLKYDIVRHVRSLGRAHSQKTFDESMRFLSQPIEGSERLLVIDNADNPKLNLPAFLPRWKNGTVIITTRNLSHGQISLKSHLRLDVMSEDEAIELLVLGSRREGPLTEPDRQTVAVVAKELGFLPIALVQAASYMFVTKCSAEEYISLLRTSRETLLSNPAMSQLDMRYQTAFAAFDASYIHLPSVAQRFMHLLSFFNRQNFPIDFIGIAAKADFSTDKYLYLARGDEFERGRSCLRDIFCSSGHWDPFELNSTIISLCSHSLVTVTRTESTRSLHMHALVHEWARLRLTGSDTQYFQDAAVRMLCSGNVEGNNRALQSLPPHIRALYDVWESLHANDAASFSSTLHESGIYSDAAKLQRISHHAVGEVLGVDHPNTVAAAANLADTYRELGHYGDAESLEVDVLKQRKLLLGVDHQDTVTASARLASTYRQLGRYSDAEVLNVEVLKQRTKLLGVDHLDTITASANLASTYHRLGRYGDAESLGAEVLKQRINLLGLNHPDTITASANLANTYRQLGRYEDAELLELDVLKQSTKVLGAEHPDTITASSNLATTYVQLGRYADAEVLNLEVVKQRTKFLGADHPDTIEASANLAATYCQLGRYFDAKVLGVEVLKQSTSVLGVDHPDTLAASANLAVTYCNLGHYGDAESLELEVLKKRTEILGVDHPDTIEASASLAGTYLQLGRYSEAEVLQIEVLKLRGKLLGLDHPDTITASASIASTYHQQGRYGDAELLELEVLKQRTKILGADHPDTITASANLANTYIQVEKYMDAELLQVKVLEQRTNLLGVDHPDTIMASADLAVTYWSLGRYDDAELLEVEVVKKRTEILGVDHPDTIEASVSLAATYIQLERYADAAQLQAEVLKQRSRLLGFDDPDTIEASASLAATYLKLGRYADAELLQVEVLKQRKNLLGVEHPEVITASVNLSLTYCNLDRYEDAELLEVEILKQMTKVLGIDHPNTIAASASLEATYLLLGRYADAELLQVNVLNQRTRLLGVNHPETIEASINLASTYRRMGRHEEAELLEISKLAGIDQPVILS